MGDFKAVLGLVFAACVAIVFIGASVLGGGSPGGNTPVSWVSGPITVDTTDIYYMPGAFNDDEEEVHRELNNPNGHLFVLMDNANSVLTITGSNVHLVITTTVMVGTIDWSAVTNEGNNSVSVIGINGDPAGTIIAPGWAE